MAVICRKVTMLIASIGLVDVVHNSPSEASAFRERRSSRLDIPFICCVAKTRCAAMQESG
jgi:hypothetical protein